MQQLPTMLVPALHRGKDTTHKTLKTMCNLRAWPQQLTLEEVCKRIQHCCATLRRSQKKEMLEVVGSKLCLPTSLRPFERGARDAAVVRALASHQCGPGLNPGIDAVM